MDWAFSGGCPRLGEAVLRDGCQFHQFCRVLLDDILDGVAALDVAGSGYAAR